MCSGSGADDEARTRYLHLGKVALYQMSYSRIFFRANAILPNTDNLRFQRFDVTSPGGIAFAAAKATAVETIH